MFRSKNKRNNAVGHQNQAQATGSGRLVNFICLVLVLLAGMGGSHTIFCPSVPIPFPVGIRHRQVLYAVEHSDLVR